MMQLILPDEVGGSPEWVTYQVHGLWQVHSFCYFPPQEMRGVRAGEMGSSRVCWHEDVSSDPKDLGKNLASAEQLDLGNKGGNKQKDP